MHDTLFSVQVVIEETGRPRLAHGLAFGGDDVVRRWEGESESADVRITAPASVLDLVRSGIVTGTSVVMSGDVKLEGDMKNLAALGQAVAGPGFLSYLAETACVPSAVAPVIAEGPAAAVVVVLAAPNDDNGELSRVAKDRTRAAVRICQEIPDARLILTGGFGVQFNTTDEPHWRHCARWLESEQIYCGDILACLETRHTYDDLLFLRELKKDHEFGEVFLVTSGYHAERVRYIAGLVLPRCHVMEVSHPGLSREQLAAFSAHEVNALGKTVAATILFGPDRLTTRLERCQSEDGKPSILLVRTP
jgi:uncharacterized SAM-binding protein YcdF (DUF218 family)